MAASAPRILYQIPLRRSQTYAEPPPTVLFLQRVRVAQVGGVVGRQVDKVPPRPVPEQAEDGLVLPSLRMVESISRCRRPVEDVHSLPAVVRSRRRPPLRRQRRQLRVGGRNEGTAEVRIQNLPPGVDGEEEEGVKHRPRNETS